MSFFEINKLCAAYGSRRILHDISLNMEAGALTALIGPNGCGKTTLIKAVCGILPHSGICTLDGRQLEDLSPRKMARLCSYVPQRSGISIDLTLMDVVLMGFNPWLGLLEHPNADMRQRAMQALKAAGLAHRAGDSYLNLSEGQKQMCILARTLVSDGQLLLLDEPESALDFPRRFDMLDMIRHWLSRQERCALMSLHDPQLAINCCDQLVLMQEGRIAGCIHPKKDAPEDMEAALEIVYGPVSLVSCRDRSGRDQWVILKEGGGWK